MALSKNAIIGIVAVAAVVIVGLIAVGAMSDSNDDSGSGYVTYYGNGGTFDGKESYDVANNIVQSNIFNREGYSFVSWNTSKDGSGTEYEIGSIASDGLKLYAIWEVEPLHVTSYNKMGVPSSISLKINDTTLDLYPYTSFYSPAKITAVSEIDDWRYDSETSSFMGTVDGKECMLKITVSGCDETSVSMEVVGGVPTVSFTASTDIGVTCSVQQKGVHYAGMGGKTTDDKEVYFTSDKDVKACMFTYEGHTFKEWNSKRDGTGTVYTVGQTVPFGTHIYAIWEENSSE